MIKSITIDHDKFSTLLENYIDNYHQIYNFLIDIFTNNKITSNEKKICSNIIDELDTICKKSALLFIHTTQIYFKDVKYIINLIYNKNIRDFNSSVVSKFNDDENNDGYYQKYLKYKNKYLQLKNTN